MSISGGIARYCDLVGSNVIANTALVAVGGAVGSALRYAVDRAYGPRSWPVATLTVNLIGSFALGLLVGWIGTRVPAELRLALFTGVLGGFTTFSTFALESTVLLRSGNWSGAAAYLALSVGVGLIGAIVGLMIGEALAAQPAR